MRAQLIQGTWAWGHKDGLQWWECQSPFCEFLTRADVDIIGAERPFIWSTEIDGMGWLQRRTAKRHLIWQSAGINLFAYLKPPMSLQDLYVPIADRNLIGHSHALQVIAYACAAGLKINRLITVGSPVRADMADVYRQARPNIASWLHVHSDGSDRIQWFGELFDGHLGIVREAPLADRNVLIAKVSHSNLLNDPEAFSYWGSRGLLSFFQGVDNARP